MVLDGQNGDLLRQQLPLRALVPSFTSCASHYANL
jgi:hypothetical protein